MHMSIPQMDGGVDESPKRNRPKFQPLNITITKSPKRTNSGNYKKWSYYFDLEETIFVCFEVLKGLQN